MIFVALFSWWYGPGWSQLAERVLLRARRALGFFSVGLLLRSLLDPFRQIDAGGVRGSMQVQMRAFFDRSFSRVVGFFLRSTMIIFGTIVALFILISGVIQLLIWPLLPLFPAAGFILMVVLR